MKKYVKILTIILLLVVLLMGSSLLYQRLIKNFGTGSRLNVQKNTETEATEEGTETDTEKDSEAQKAIDFTVVDADNVEVTLSSLIGKPIILNFWASWCSPCKSEMPEFQTAYETYGSDVQFVMVNLTDGELETMETAGSFIAEQGYTFPTYYDVNQDAAYAYSINAIPTTYFIDADGTIAASTQGALDTATMEKGIAFILPD